MSDTQLETGFTLDRLYRWMEGLMDGSKRPTLALLARILSEQKVAYAVIGGVALQVHRHEPRTTIDIDLALVDRAAWPATALEAVGFRRTGTFEHSENWLSADGTPVQITDDPVLSACVARAGIVEIDGLPLPILAPLDLLRAKLRAAADPARRRSKRLLDLADAQGLVEDHSELLHALEPPERVVLEQLRP
ncbi:MAG: hypothetical protein KBA72_06555 [Thermoanaerobaculia bacterium]|nr:hypothetical protein [Thermoanaerobaculia bacterium]